MVEDYIQIGKLINEPFKISYFNAPSLVTHEGVLIPEYCAHMDKSVHLSSKGSEKICYYLASHLGSKISFKGKSFYHK